MLFYHVFLPPWIVNPFENLELVIIFEGGKLLLIYSRMLQNRPKITKSADFSRENGIPDIYIKYLNFKMLALVSSLRPLHEPRKTSIQANYDQANARLILVQCVFYSGGH